MRGRPKLYTEARTLISLHLPDWLLERLDEESHKMNVTRTELITSILSNNLDNETSKIIAIELSKLRDLVNKNSKIIEEAGRRIVVDIYKNIEPDELVKQAYEKNKKDWIRIYNEHNGNVSKIVIETWNNIIYEELEVLALKKGKAIKNKNIAKQMIKKLMFTCLD